MLIQQDKTEALYQDLCITLNLHFMTTGTHSKANKHQRVVPSVAVNNIVAATDPIRSICRHSVISLEPG